MAIRMEKPWRALTAAEVAALPGHLGVYQIADHEYRVVYIGYAGGRGLWGLRGAVQAQLAARGADHYFRLEVNQQYMSRWQELLAVHLADHGDLPAGNESDRPRRIGRLSPG